PNLRSRQVVPEIVHLLEIDVGVRTQRANVLQPVMDGREADEYRVFVLHHRPLKFPIVDTITAETEGRGRHAEIPAAPLCDGEVETHAAVKDAVVVADADA